jgi:hypothetical protein
VTGLASVSASEADCLVVDEADLLVLEEVASMVVSSDEVFALGELFFLDFCSKNFSSSDLGPLPLPVGSSFLEEKGLRGADSRPETDW